MSQKIKVQDGNIVYSNADPTQPVNMTVLGDTNVTNQLIVGSVNTPADGVISSGDGHPATISAPAYFARLDIIAGNYGSLNLSQSSYATSAITINGVQWPSALPPSSGMFLGTSSTTGLAYLPFVIGSNPNDSLTVLDLNTLYPNAIAGQSVAGITVLYMCVGPGLWRMLGQSSGGSIAAPLNEIIYGTGPAVTSSPNLTFDSTTGTLTVGTTGSALISAEPAQSMKISSDVSITLATNSVDRVILETTGAISVNGSVGTSGQLLVSSGPSAPPSWQTITSPGGTVSFVGGTGAVSGLTLSGSITTSGNITLGGTLVLTSGDITSGLGFTPYNASNPAGYTANTGTVTSVAVSGTSGRITGSGTITTTGTVTLDLAASGVAAGSYTSADLTIDAYGRVTSASNGATGSGLGYSQTWQNVTGSRAVSTTYFNTTGKPIVVFCFSSRSGASFGGGQLTVAGISFTTCYSSSSNCTWTVQAIVPIGAAYSATFADGLAGWYELR